MANYQRPEGGWRFQFGGLNVRNSADSLPPVQYPYAQNIRGVSGSAIQTRPGYANEFSTAAAAITDIRAYATLETDNLPRILAHNASSQIYLDDGSLVATLAGSSQGAFMIPYRPNRSPQPWMYIGTVNDYQKLSAPDSADAVTAYGVGIAEQQDAPDAAPEAFNYYDFSALATNWTNGGTAGALSDVSRGSDTSGAIFEDPASGSVKRCSVEVSTTDNYQIGMIVTIDTAGTPIDAVVQDVIPPMNAGSAVQIEAIHYFSGSTGRCIIVPRQVPTAPSVPAVAGNLPVAQSIYADSVVSSLRRGAIVNLNGTEDVLVLSVTTGPNGTICFECETTGTFAATNTITGLPAIVVSGITSANAGDTVDAAAIQSTVSGAGTATVSQALGTNPFDQLLAPSTRTPQLDDYVALSINISDLSAFTIGTITFNVGNTVNYTDDAFYAQFDGGQLIAHAPSQRRVFREGPPPRPEVVQTFDPAALTPGELEQYVEALIASGIPEDAIEVNFSEGTITVDPTIAAVSSTTPLPSSQWTTIIIPLRSLRRIGNDLTKTLSDCNGVRISIETTAGLTLEFGSLWVGGGGQPDVGTDGSPYFYLVRGRSSETGATSNPSPISRYGVSPRRQQVRISMTDTTGDAQLDLWDIFRYGGSISSWRYIGSVENSGSADTFTDDMFDTVALGGGTVEYDNFEPWPTVGLPVTWTAGTVAGITLTLTAIGTALIVTWSAAAPFTNPAPATILRWLPGTLVTLGGQNAYTLRQRPVAITLASPPATDYFSYRLEFVENAGSATISTVSIAEPVVANQHLPYLWGPDAFGTIFAAGDPFRPGSFYYCKAFNPDSAPDRNNQELTAPSEPILGGEILRGVSYAASTKRWWQLQPQFGAGVASRYQPVELPIPRGLAAPYAHCTDGSSLYFVAKDGIWRGSPSAADSLTDRDLYPLFPREGVVGANVTYAGSTVYAPDYRYASLFRLCYSDGYLYFDYRDSDNTPRTLVCDLRDPENPAWVVDVYGDAVTAHYGVEQQAGTLEGTTARYPYLFLGDTVGNVHRQTINSNDDGTAIPVILASFEYNGGDLRAEQLYDDIFIDVTPLSAITARPISDGATVASDLTIAASASRTRTQLNAGLELKYLGLRLIWTDDFGVISTPTIAHAWQPLYQGVPISIKLWSTQGMGFGLPGYKHVRQITAAYKSTSTVTLTFTVYDGTAPDPIVLPSTGGEYRKVTFPLSFNKAMLYFLSAESAAEWTPYLSDWEIYVGAWNRSEGYTVFRDIPGPQGIRSG